MSLISLVDASKDFGIRTLFEGLTLHVREGDRLGLIGPNGAGKSTLLRVLAGLEPLGSGERRCSARLRVELVGQESRVDPGLTVLEQVLAGCGKKRDLLLRFSEVSEAVAKTPDDTALMGELGALSERMDEEEAWALEQQCQEVLQRLGISDLHRPVEDLSGGYRKRVGLASALVACPDVLLLDAPPHHLDAAAVEWRQCWLDRYPGAVVLVTDDRYVLDQVTRRIVEVERGVASSIDGNYSAYLQRKADQEVADAAEAARFKSVMRRELAWLRQGPKARSTKQRARIERIEALKASPTKQAKQELAMSSVSRRIGKVVIEAEELTVTTDGQPGGPSLLRDFTYSFSPEDRVGIIGPNGSGKSTLLDLIAGRRQVTSGSLRLGDTVHLGYLDQHTDALSEGRGLERKVIEFVEEAASRIELAGEQLSASQLLERFLFPPAQQHSPLNKLSGGERRRLSLCRMLIQAPNVLLLDEPTNDLDVQTLSVLEDLLEDFRGCVVVVSHDRYFLDRTIDRLFCFEDGRLKRFEGNYSAFLDHKRALEKNSSEPSSVPKETASSKKKLKKSSDSGPRRRSFKESRELETLEQTLPDLEKRKADLEEAIGSGQGDLTNLSQDLATLLERIQESEERWLELSELAP